jgi:Fe-S-cluster containining protein
MEFNCIKDCSQCCIEREYYPSKRFGKIGVLILPQEKERIEGLAKTHKIDVTILPRVGTSNKTDSGPTEIIAYQMMGIEKNGNTCPFLDTASDKRSLHGGFTCRIYQDRPLACKAYPVIDDSPITLDAKCKFCQQYKTADQNLASEIESLIQIKNTVSSDAKVVWRYATGVGDQDDMQDIETGWICLQ